MDTLLPSGRTSSIAYLESTREELLGVVSSLTPGQLAFQPRPDRWSIAQILEHLAVVEGRLAGNIERALAAPPDVSAPERSAAADAKLQQMFANRVNRREAPEPVRPVGRYASRDEMLGQFNQGRARILDVLRTASQDLRLHVAPHPLLGPLDVLQWTLFAAAHTARHTEQMREVMNDERFPAS